MYVLHSALITKVSFGFMNLPVVSAHGHTTQPTHINVSTFIIYWNFILKIGLGLCEQNSLRRESVLFD